MKNNIKKGLRGCFQLALWLILLVPVTIGASAATSTVVTCPAPSNVSVTGKTSTSISFSWSAVSNASGYQVYYVRTSDSTTSSVMTTSGNSITVYGLTPGTYRFYFASVCEGGTSEYVISDDLLIN